MDGDSGRNKYGKGKGSPYNRLLRPLGWVDVQLYPFWDLGTEDGGGGQHHK